MGSKYKSRVSALLGLVCSLAFSMRTLTQTPANLRPKPTAERKEADKDRESDLLDAERRTFAIALVTSLADEARSYQDLQLRTRVLARAADTLWEVNSATSRSLFQRAWDAAEEADAQEPDSKKKGAPPPMVMALRRISGQDLRVEVIGLAARRDRALAEEFLAKLKDEKARAAKDARNDADARTTDGWSASEQVTKRLVLARKLIDEGQIELALEIATPALNEVNVHSINFLSTLREKRPDVADERFALLLARAELDPASDANTVSGLSSYIFTPGFYVTFSADGGSRWTQPDGNTIPPNVPPTLRSRFLHVAATILLRPLPPLEQDFSSAGRAGKHQVIKRLLPAFDREAPETAAALRTQLTTLNIRETAVRPENNGSTYGINPAQNENPLQRIQEQVDRAKSSRERDEVYADAAVSFSQRGDPRAKEFADKIEDSARRLQLRRYVDLQFIQQAIKQKNAPEVIRIARSGPLTHMQRVWAYTQAATLLIDSEQTVAFELLEEAASEARRIDADDPDRARSLIGVATQFVARDQVRAWELVGEAVKAANSAETFTGENEQLSFSLLVTRSGVKTVNIRAEDFVFAGLIRSLAEADLTRTVDIAKSFKNVAPRATAILTVAQTVLNKRASGSLPAKL